MELLTDSLINQARHILRYKIGIIPPPIDEKLIELAMNRNGYYVTGDGTFAFWAFYEEPICREKE